MRYGIWCGVSDNKVKYNSQKQIFVVRHPPCISISSHVGGAQRTMDDRGYLELFPIAFDKNDVCICIILIL